MPKKKILLSAGLCLILLLALTVPVLASTYQYTGTSFRYIGDIFHEKTFKFINGSGSFSIEGIGRAEGTHDVHSAEKDDVRKSNIVVNLSGTTDSNNALDLERMEKAMIDRLESQRAQEIAALNNMLRNTDRMRIEDYESELQKINAYYDDMIREVKSGFADAKKNLRILSSLQINNPKTKATVNIGVEMNPGESGYIKQSVVSNSSADGEYMRINNRFGNTGGKTAKTTEIPGYMSEVMTVEGYAEVWESTEVRSGKAKGGGWWFTMP